MPENLIDRPDIASQKARDRNTPLVLMPGNENYGAAETPIYFYNVSTLEWNTPRPPNHPHMYIRPCPKDEPYVIARGSITHPFAEIREDQNENKFPVFTNGYREATRMMNPMNPGVDQSFAVENDLYVGDNLNAYGVFWSTHNPPLQEEVDAALLRMKATYRKELERMGRAKTADEALGMRNRISSAAADYFGVSSTWHQTDLISRDYGKVDCGMCGEKIQPTAKICKECGAPTDPDKQAAWLDAKTSPNLPGGKRT